MSIQNERVKLLATYLNGLAIAVLAIGGLAPIFSYVYGASPTRQPLWLVALVSLICLIASAIPHYSARYSLRGLRP